MKQIFKRPLILFGLILLPFFYNNCAKIRFESLLASVDNSVKQAESDNGTGYGGKLTYYHYIPGYVCENRNSPFSKLEYSPAEQNSILTSSKENQCLSIPGPIPNSEIDSGSLQNRVIGYGERIFESNSAGPAVVPESPIEIWCVDQWKAPTIEILSLYNKAENHAETQFYFPSVPKRTEPNPSRVVNQQTVHLSSKYFDLLVDKSKSGLKPGTIGGTLTISEGASTQTLQCRLGGYLDARLWPAKAVQFDVLAQMEWNPLEGLFYTVSGQTSPAPWSENVLSTFSGDGTQRKVLIGNTSNTRGVYNFKFSADRTNLFVQAALAGDVTTQLYSLNPKAPAAPRRLNDILTDLGQYVSGEIVSDPSSDLVYYMDGAQETGQDIEQWLRAVSLTTGNITQINKSLFGADEGVGQFEVSYSLGKVIYSAGFVEHEIWMTDLLGGNPRKIDLSSYLGSTYWIEYYVKKASRWLMMNDRYLVLVATPRSYLYGKSLLLTIDLATEKVAYLYEVPGIPFLSPVPALPLVRVGNSENLELYLDLTTGLLNSASEIQTILKNSNNIKGQQYAASLTILKALDLCEDGEKLIARIRVNESNWLLIKRGSVAAASIFLISNDSTNCRMINRLAFPDQMLDRIATLYEKNPSLEFSNYGNYFGKAVLSPDQRNLLLSIMGRLYLIPTDGHPILEVYTPLNLMPSFSEIGFVNNSKVYFNGSVIKDFSNQLFLWDIPKY
jgi:hypothetical protein